MRSSTALRLVLGPSNVFSGGYRAPDPCPREEVTDQRIAGPDGRDPIREAATAAAPYQLDMFRQSKNFDFAESLRNHPDPPAAGRFPARC